MYAYVNIYIYIYICRLTFFLANFQKNWVCHLMSLKSVVFLCNGKKSRARRKIPTPGLHVLVMRNRLATENMLGDRENLDQKKWGC